MVIKKIYEAVSVQQYLGIKLECCFRFRFTSVKFRKLIKFWNIKAQKNKPIILRD